MSLHVKVYGAGSIGNHLAHASRSLNWNVDVVDIDEDALVRMKENIYPMRYKKWDETIGLFKLGKEKKKNYDIIIIGTPPESHLELAKQALNESPKIILVEKPLSDPNLKKIQLFKQQIKNKKTQIFIGYDHVVSDSINKFLDHLKKVKTSEIETLDVEFREHWGGIFDAHFWLDGPKDSYLGFTKLGGGALLEHSHAINLWQTISNELGFGKITEVSAKLDYFKDNELEYDKVSLLNVRSERGLIGRIVQDVVTFPTRKIARVQCKKSYFEWNCGYTATSDCYKYGEFKSEEKIFEFKKTRPDDFINELLYIYDKVFKKKKNHRIDIEKGIETMKIIEAAIFSNKHNRTVYIDHNEENFGKCLNFGAK